MKTWGASSLAWCTHAQPHCTLGVHSSYFTLLWHFPELRLCRKMWLLLLPEISLQNMPGMCRDYCVTSSLLFFHSFHKHLLSTYQVYGNLPWLHTAAKTLSTFRDKSSHSWERSLSRGDSTEPELPARVMKAVAYSLRRSHTECQKRFQCLVSFIKKRIFWWCCAACGILFPDQWLNLHSSLHWKFEAQLDHQGSPSVFPFLFKFWKKPYILTFTI